MKKNTFTLMVLLLHVAGCCFAQQLQELKPLLDAAKGQQVIEIPKGTYLLNNARDGAYQFIGLEDVEIRGNGSAIICNSQELAFRFLNCSNVRISGFSVDYAPLCFTQGSIIDMDSAKTWFDVLIDKGYPVENVRNDRVQFYDAVTRELKRNSITTGTGHYQSLTKTADRVFRLVKNGQWTANEHPGDLVVLDVGAAKANPAAHAIQLEQCVNATLEDITVYGSNGFSFYERNCSATRYNRCRVDRGPVEPGVAPRLRSGNADGIHSSMAKVGPIIENCIVRHNGDDCFVVCGRSFPVGRIAVSEKAIYLLSREGAPVFNVGDTLQRVGYDAVKREKLKVAAAASFVPTQEEQQAVLEKYPHLLFKGNYTRGVRIVLESFNDSIRLGDIIYNDTHTGKGFVIRNNKGGHNRSRGILIKSSNGEIYDNEITGTAMNGLLIAPELTWMGGGFADHVRVYNNLFSDCMFERTNKGMPPGVLSVFCADALLRVPGPGSFSQIRVSDNRVEQSPLPGFAFTAVQGLYQSGNRMAAAPDNVRNHGQNFGVTFEAPIWEMNNTP